MKMYNAKQTSRERQVKGLIKVLREEDGFRTSW